MTHTKMCPLNHLIFVSKVSFNHLNVFENGGCSMRAKQILCHTAYLL